jgi:putrescine transport system substrate-binding protein
LSRHGTQPGRAAGLHRLCLAGVFCAGLALLLTSPQPLAASERQELNVYSWADYIAPDTIKNFEREYGIKVNYDTYDSTATVEARLLAGSTGYDVVDIAYQNAARLVPIGVFQPLDRARLPGLENLDPWVMDRVAFYDPDNLHGIPYMWGSTGFAYNQALVDKHLPAAPVSSADMVFDPEVVSRLAACGVTWLDEPTDMIPMALVYLGLDHNSLEPGDLARVEALLKSVRPYIRYFSSTRMMNDLPNEEVCVAMSWSGDYAQAMARAAEVGLDLPLQYTAPVEGSIMWADGMFIPAGAPNPDAAHLFLDYLMRPEVIADISNYINYANANLAAEPFMREDLLANPAVYPGPEARERLRQRVSPGPKQERILLRTWSRVKTGL